MKWIAAAALLAALGCQGPVGPQGAPGPAGPQGMTGAQGAKGDPGDPLAAVVPVAQYDAATHAVATTNMSVAQAICLARHGIWDSGTSTCGSPLAYGTVTVPRTDSDPAAVASCPSGYVPADCWTAYFLLTFWRMTPETEAPNGHAWCAGTMDGTLNSGAGYNGPPMFWYAAGTSAPTVCPGGSALVVDQITSAQSYPRPHLYCQSTTQLNKWMCISTRLP